MALALKVPRNGTFYLYLKRGMKKERNEWLLLVPVSVMWFQCGLYVGNNGFLAFLIEAAFNGTIAVS